MLSDPFDRPSGRRTCPQVSDAYDCWVSVVINGRFLLSSFGGVRRYATEITERLAMMRDDVVLACPPLPADVVPLDVPVATVGRTGGPLWEQVELPRWLKNQGSPLLLNLANVAPVTYANQISVLYDIAPGLRPADFTPGFRLQWRVSARLGMLRRPHGTVTISETSRQEIADYFRVDPGTIGVIACGADSLDDGRALSTDAVDSTAASRFVVFGRHGAGKNVRVVIDALAALPTDAPIEVRMIGKLDPALEPYARECGVPETRIAWLGPVTDAELVDEYRRAAGFVWPSLHEGFGLPPVEAQTLGVPVIASDIPINREILGDSAVYFPPRDAAALVAALLEVSGDAVLRAGMGESGRANARRYSWEDAAREWNALVEERVEGTVA